MKKLFPLLLATLLAAPCLGADISLPKRPQGWVSDLAGLASAPERQALNSLAAGLERATSAELAVVTVKTLDGIPVEEYAVKLFEKWGIGKKGKDNGLLILVSVADRAVRIEVGYGLEGVIPDGVAGRIIREKITPEFRNGRYGAGLYAAAATAAALVAKDAGVALPELSGTKQGDYSLGAKRGPGELIFTVIFIMLFLGRGWLFPFLIGRALGGGYWSSGRGGFGGGGGGFGGFGGGMSGGGGASGRW